MGVNLRKRLVVINPLLVNGKTFNMDHKISITINTDRNTTIRDCIAANKIHLIQELSVVGEFKSYEDNPTIRIMCNSLDKDGNRTGGQLEFLDLSDAKIFHCYINNIPYDYGDLRWNYGFKDCVTLKTIRFGSSDLKLKGDYFSGCTSLENIEVSGHHSIYTTKDGVLYKKRPHDPKQEYFVSGKLKIIKVPAKVNDSKIIDFESISHVEAFAFENTEIREFWLPKVPPICNKDAFHGVDVSKITIHVPAEAYSSYWSHPVWGEFNIEANMDRRSIIG